MANAISPFGDGHAAERIADIIAQLVSGKIAG
jgi:UDP-N-acetylglucosamine 2-epimerase